MYGECVRVTGRLGEGGEDRGLGRAGELGSSGDEAMAMVAGILLIYF